MSPRKGKFDNLAVVLGLIFAGVSCIIGIIALLYGEGIIERISGGNTSNNNQNTPNVTVVYPIDGGVVDLTRVDDIDGNLRGTFVARGTSSNVVTNPNLSVYVVTTDPWQNKWWVYDTVVRANGDWEATIWVGFASEKNPFYVQVIVADRSRVNAIPIIDNQRTINSPSDLYPLMQTDRLLLDVGEVR